MTSRLKYIREKMGMNMREFSTYLGIKYTTYAGYENGSREPGYDFIVLVANYCNTTADFILGLTEQDHIPPKPEIISFTGENPLKVFLSEAEYQMLIAFQAADDRAQKDALALLLTHKKS